MGTSRDRRPGRARARGRRARPPRAAAARFGCAIGTARRRPARAGGAPSFRLHWRQSTLVAQRGQRSPARSAVWREHQQQNTRVGGAFDDKACVSSLFQLARGEATGGKAVRAPALQLAGSAHDPVAIGTGRQRARGLDAAETQHEALAVAAARHSRLGAAAELLGARGHAAPLEKGGTGSSGRAAEHASHSRSRWRSTCASVAP